VSKSGVTTAHETNNYTNCDLSAPQLPPMMMTKTTSGSPPNGMMRTEGQVGGW